MEIIFTFLSLDLFVLLLPTSAYIELSFSISMVSHMFFFLCSPIMCLYVLSFFVLWCPLRFLHKNDIWFVFTSSCLQKGLRLIYAIYVCFSIVVSNTYCHIVYLMCTLCSQCLWIVHFWLPLRYSLTFNMKTVSWCK